MSTQLLVPIDLHVELTEDDIDLLNVKSLTEISHAERIESFRMFGVIP